MFTQKPPQTESVLSEMDFDQPAVNIGSHPDNDIVLDGTRVRPFHASLVLQNGECQVLALEPEAEIRLDGKIVQTARFDLASAAKRLEVGDCAILLEYNQARNSLHVRLNRAGLPSESKPGLPPAAPSIPDSAILVNLIAQTDEVEVNQTASYEFEIVNAGPLVASFKVQVEDVPEEWVSITPDEINLYEGQRTLVRINITPPRRPESTAGQHTLKMVVSSGNYAGRQVVTPIILNIKPYYEFTLGNLSPREQNVYWPKRMASTSLPITNLGNSQADLTVAGMDDENGCTFDFVVGDGLRLSRQTALHLAAGQTLPLPIEISPHKRPIFAFRNKRYAYTTTVQVTNQPVTPQMVSGSLTSHPLLGWWLVPLMLLMLAVLFVLTFWPRIYSFQVAASKDIIELGDTTKLEWSVSPFADRVSISNTTQLLNSGQNSLTIAPTQSTTYELVAGNLLSGLLKMDQHASQTVLVIPPSPNINVFSVDQERVAKGKPVKVRWSVTQADQAFLTVDEVVYELGKDKFSGEQEVILEKTALVTLEAKNASGSDLRSAFVNVDEPNITVVSFRVWVRPKSGAALPTTGSGGKLTAPVIAPPDPSFSEIYVELLQNRESDTGYQVHFTDEKRELDKGEQVMVEWYVKGTDSEKVQLAPFAEALPARGIQPFFPQEPMNFVLTAKSGELENLYMLPVKVFTGEPPVAPKIEFFQGVPLSLIGPQKVEFSWSVSGVWDRVQLSNGKSIIADYLNPQGFKSVIVSQSGTFILTAWNGSLSSAKPLDIVVNPALISLKNKLVITGIYPNGDQFMVGDKITVSVTFNGLPTDKPFPKNNIIVSDGSSSCTIELPARSCDLTFTTEGKKKLEASYSGDEIYQQVTSAKYPANKDILVSSPTVLLTPDFYLTPAKTTPIVVTTQQFSIAQNLYVTITVTPEGAVLPVDDKGKVSLSICEQQNTKSCTLTTTVTVVVDDVTGIGTAEIVIAGFPGAGTYALRFDYRHTDNLLAPTTLTPQPKINVSKMGIYLTLPPTPDCNRGYTFFPNTIKSNANCMVGYSVGNIAQVVFFIHQKVNGRYLVNTLPKPEITPFTVSVANKPVQCSVITATPPDEPSVVSYALKCNADLSGKSSVLANYKFVNASSSDYFMDTKDFSSQPFYLLPIVNTSLEFKVESFKVGQIIKLVSTAHASDYLSLYVKGTTTPVRNISGKISLTSTSSNPDNLFGVTDISTCTIADNGASVINIDVDESCEIFFRKAGEWDLHIEFDGDANYAPSSADVAGIQVSKQDLVTVTWYYKEAGASWQEWPTSLVPFNLTNSTPPPPPPQILEGKFTFGGPEGFSPKALDGVSLDLTLKIGTSCKFVGAAPSEILYQNKTAIVSFTLSCPVPSGLSISMALAPGAAADFAMAPGQITSRTGVFASTRDGLTPGLKVYLNRVGDAAKLLTNKIDMLYAGEKYTVSFILDNVWGDTYDYTCAPDTTSDPACHGTRTVQQGVDLLLYETKPNVYRRLSVTLPASWKKWITTSSDPSVCSLDQDKNLIIPFTKIYAYEVYGFALLTGGFIDKYQEIPDTSIVYDGNDPFSATNSIKDLVASNYNCMGYKYCWIYAQFRSPIVGQETKPCTVTFNFSGITTKIGAGQATTFSLAPSFTDNLTGMSYWVNNTYTVDGLKKASVTFTPFTPPSKSKFLTTVPVGSPAQIVTMTFKNADSPASTRDPITSDVPSKWFDVSYPACMKLEPKVYPNQNKVVWTLTPPRTTYPCTGTLKISYKENTYFGAKLLVNQAVNFKKKTAAADSDTKTVAFQNPLGVVPGWRKPAGTVSATPRPNACLVPAMLNADTRLP